MKGKGMEGEKEGGVEQREDASRVWSAWAFDYDGEGGTGVGQMRLLRGGGLGRGRRCRGEARNQTRW